MPILGWPKPTLARISTSTPAGCLKPLKESGYEDLEQPSPCRQRLGRVLQPARGGPEPAAYRIRISANERLGAGRRRWGNCAPDPIGYRVVASDIADYGLENCRTGIDYLKAKTPAGVEAVVTNPPYKLAVQFAEKALREVPYLALLLRTNFLESTARLPFFRKHQPARIWISSRRLPMMHRHGWQGPRAPSNTCFAWFVWDRNAEQKRVIDWFDWKHGPARRGFGDMFEDAQERLRAVA